jgi:hypothetical protein
VLMAVFFVFFSRDETEKCALRRSSQNDSTMTFSARRISNHNRKLNSQNASTRRAIIFVRLICSRNLFELRTKKPESPKTRSECPFTFLLSLFFVLSSSSSTQQQQSIISAKPYIETFQFPVHVLALLASSPYLPTFFCLYTPSTPKYFSMLGSSRSLAFPHWGLGPCESICILLCSSPG